MKEQAGECQIYEYFQSKDISNGAHILLYETVNRMICGGFVYIV